MKQNTDIILDIPISRRKIAELVSEAIRAIEKESQSIMFACANPHSLIVSRQDPVFKNALLSANQVVCDGVGVTLMARVIGVDVGPRITGTDYFFALMKALNKRKLGRVFFFGSSESILTLISDRFVSDFSNVTLCGTLSPPVYPWRVQENDEMIEVINHAKPDVLWVGMTAPKQEKWVFENRKRINATVIGCIGAVFDFYAGTHARAPEWVRKIGFEWLYRLVRSPKRLWQRTLKSAPQFIFLCLWHSVLKKFG